MKVLADTTTAALHRIGIPLPPEQLAADIEFCHVSTKQCGNVTCYHCGNHFPTTDKAIVICPKCKELANEPSYYRMTTIGDKTKFTWRPLGIIGICFCRTDSGDNIGAIRNCLIGFLYPDDSIRQDIIQVLNNIYEDRLGVVNWPEYVMFWRDHVPMTHRASLAAYKGLHDTR